MAGYGDDASAAAYWAAAGYTVPSGTVAAARQIGSVYLDGAYELFFPGVPTGGAEQDRSWPRTGASDRYGNAIDPNTVPTRVINASYEAAFIELTNPGSLSIVGSNSGRVKRERVEGAVEVEYVGASGSSVATDNRVVSTLIEGMLAPLLMPLLPGILVV